MPDIHQIINSFPEENEAISHLSEKFRNKVNEGDLEKIIIQLGGAFPRISLEDEKSLKRWIIFHKFLNETLSLEEIGHFAVILKGAPSSCISRESKRDILINLGYPMQY